ncbi:MAG: serine/threonine-protein kinase, partial [Bacteroidota bacterium]
MIGQTILHYKILEKLGEGGMGVVYKAHDTKLDRFVALKFLPAHATVNAETKARFTQEAKAAAALNHPNICTIHGVDEVDGNLFIVMEYIDGGTLREKVPYQKVDDAVSIAIQIGDALHEAHSKGIVHRDVKADNIMLTSKGQIKVMDFGLAKLKGSLKLTRTSSTVGTLAYMAPEQIQGGEVDQRSDIFSFGVLLFEMLTGKFPFRGEHEAALLYSIVNEEPESITKYIPDASAGLQQIFDKALEKDPAVRYHSVDDMVVDLRRTKKQTSRVSKIIPITPADSTQNIPVQKAEPAAKNTLFIRSGIAIVIVLIAY